MIPPTIVPSMNPERDTSSPAAALATPGSRLKPDPAKIIVPRKHGQILIEPPLAELTPALQTTRDFSAIRFAGIPWQTLRDEARTTALASLTPQPKNATLNQPWVLTGHQVEFYHCGVWAKVLAVDELARRTSALPIDLLVDHDVVDHLGFDVPFPADQNHPLTRRLITWADAPDAATDSIPAPSSVTLAHFLHEVAASPLAHTDTLALITPAFEENAGGQYVPFVSDARRTMEESLDIHVPRLTSSALCDSLAWHHFILAWARNAAAWSAIYNTRLQDYRARQKIKNPSQPMPNLQTVSGVMELPFWIYRPGQPRQRLSLDTHNLFICGTESLDARDAIGDATLDGAKKLQQLLTKNHWVIRPRALTLTMFIRLFVADLFVHGIGGALYDQITDDILQDLFGIQPPYACVSAAWLLPLGQAKEADHIPALHSQRHHLKHNPQQAIDAQSAQQTDIAELLQERYHLIASLKSSVSTQRHTGRDARRHMFRRLHTVNAALHEKIPATLSTLDQQIATAIEQRQLNQVLLHREYFWGLHALSSLREFHQRFRAS